MKRCLQIANNGIGTTRPNPSVGAVVVYNNKIVGEGYTSNYGENHAEVNAINSVKDKTILKDATLYVTLEPCSHFGKTPPCANLIVKHQIKNVVIGCLDSNNLVAGKGVKILKKAGINVYVGVLEEECRKHHRRFFTVQEKKRPYIVLKWAETSDGFIAPLVKDEQKPIWISNSISQQLVHKFRSEEHAILVGTNTVFADNPKLNVRSWTGNNPVRVVLDKSLRIRKDVNIFDKSVKTIIITKQKNSNNTLHKNLFFETIDFSNNIASEICKVLHKHQIQSVIVEGGAKTLQTFIDANLWDEAKVFVGETLFEKGIRAPLFKADTYSESKIKKDVLKIYRND
ncbi:bifunctional diaminohydroxyphosphoribosylaminopyrimidine deaminase/5-amino-6-(5-phosphoribosylamino)uracil reductase RibD [Polaribacter sp. MSW5]|uniref:Riboflavin biosynthesis protein RibD n=1 Tax=Polaribacter ponticola TaxID=2978475 RepID=A0ABT5S8P5_9FLAO|nr:bifunctional diaminohydroxyphosphoribosylaminopyrimidine deaminase/5-amino-6-(5-phosphoribosylamino)uracil reductase RibD [Polaribacter sp. MSW5]MDD7914467.1 bifunctional diaminohydroxyphosphoribosylaminopyrimidine deaminase/5-amino-6-(5-phosphoribosylamino)uracil reductase RibD [Polaribacter sp. MSW5]